MDQIGWLCYLATEWNSPESWHYRRPFWSSESLISLFEGILPRFTHLGCNFFNKPDEINGEEPVVQVNPRVQNMKSIVLLCEALQNLGLPPNTIGSCAQRAASFRLFLQQDFSSGSAEILHFEHIRTNYGKYHFSIRSFKAKNVLNRDQKSCWGCAPPLKEGLYSLTRWNCFLPAPSVLVNSSSIQRKN